jgi:hypothetical protein
MKKKRTPSQRLARLIEALERSGVTEQTEIKQGNGIAQSAFYAWSELIGAISWDEPELAERIRPGILDRLKERERKYQENVAAFDRMKSAKVSP